MIDILASTILLLTQGAIIIWAWREPGFEPFLVVLVSVLIIGLTILGLLGLISDPYCLRC